MPARCSLERPVRSASTVVCSPGARDTGRTPTREATVTVWAAEQDPIGRDAEVQLIRSLLDRAVAGGAVLLVARDPDVGTGMGLQASTGALQLVVGSPADIPRLLAE